MFEILIKTGSPHFLYILVKVKEKDDLRLVAVKMKLFGAKTRLVHEWHPAKQLAKRFNVPEPFPSSDLIGVPSLQVWSIFRFTFKNSLEINCVRRSIFFRKQERPKRWKI